MSFTSTPGIRRSVIIALAAAVVCSACGVSLQFETDQDVGPTSEELIDIDEFTELEIDSAFEVDLTVGQGPSLTIEISESLLDDLEVTQDGQRLKLDVDARNITGSHVLNATISTPDIEAISVDGAVRLNIDELDVDDLVLEADGASRVEGSGQVSELTLNVDGAARLDLDQMSIGTVQIDADGAANITVEQAERVEGKLDGAARLGVGDDTQVLVDTSGASAVD